MSKAWVHFTLKTDFFYKEIIFLNKLKLHNKTDNMCRIFAFFLDTSVRLGKLISSCSHFFRKEIDGVAMVKKLTFMVVPGTWSL